MYSKADIFNLALGALLLSRRVTDPDTDKSNEAKVLLTHYDTAFQSALEDMNLDSTSTTAVLELIENNPNNLWLYSYKYPTDCVLIRRVVPPSTLIETRKDDAYTQIRRQTRIKDGQKVILTNQSEAELEYITKSVPLSALSSNAGLCIAYKLASLSTPLITGKGAANLRASILQMYSIYKSEAQEKDKLENEALEHEWEESEFVKARLS